MYDVAVIGLGAMGAATSWSLSKRGRRVIGFDAYQPGHAFGSSHGRSRIIRKAYLEGADYVPLVLRAYELWGELEQDGGQLLFVQTGGLLIGSPQSRTIAGALKSARAHGLDHEYLDPGGVAARFPGLRLAADQMAVFEPEAGILDAQACIDAMLHRATMEGAELRFSTPVRDWVVDGSGIRIRTNDGEALAERLIVTVGPWAGELLAELNLPLVVRRIVVGHFEPTRPEWYVPGVSPVYIWELADGTYYGFPNLPGQGVKVGYHDGGDICTPSTIRREVEDDDVLRLRRALNFHLPGAFGTTLYAVTCMYTNTPDRHFVVGQHPASERVYYACGFSGHGFKFATVIGEALGDLAVDGATAHQLEFLSPARFANSSMP